jgi:hypothetical protein
MQYHVRDELELRQDQPPNLSSDEVMECMLACRQIDRFCSNPPGRAGSKVKSGLALAVTACRDRCCLCQGIGGSGRELRWWTTCLHSVIAQKQIHCHRDRPACIDLCLETPFCLIHGCIVFAPSMPRCTMHTLIRHSSSCQLTIATLCHLENVFERRTAFEKVRSVRCMISKVALSQKCASTFFGRSRVLCSEEHPSAE